MNSTQRLIQSVVASAMDPAMLLLPAKMESGLARVHLVAIGLKESDLRARAQIGGGPARGLWQFELGSRAKGGGVWGVFLHAASREPLRQLCLERGVQFSPAEIYAALERDDVLAAGVARLLLWTDRQALPKTQASAWQLYAKRTWCPGTPRPEKWPPSWQAAVEYGALVGWISVDDKGAIQ